MNRAINDDPVSEGIMMRRKTYLVGAAGLFSSAVNHNNDTSTDRPDSRSGNTDGASYGERFGDDTKITDQPVVDPDLRDVVIVAAVCAATAFFLLLLICGACICKNRAGQKPQLPPGNKSTSNPASQPATQPRQKAAKKRVVIPVTFDQLECNIGSGGTIKLDDHWKLAPDRTIEITREDCCKIVEKIVDGTWKPNPNRPFRNNAPSFSAVKAASWKAYKVKFGKLNKTQKKEKVRFKLISVDCANSMDEAKTSKAELIPLVPKAGDMYTEEIAVNFCNKYIGGGVLGDGMAQEEIGMCCIPELLLNLCLMGNEALKPNEALVTSNLIRYNVINGDKNAAELDQAAFEPTSARGMTVVSMDATDFRSSGPFANDCDVVKAMAGFDFMRRICRKNRLPIAGGLWGCGVFAGNDKNRWEKSMCTQWLVASICGATQLRFYHSTRPGAQPKPDGPNPAQLEADLRKYAGLAPHGPVSVAKLYEFLMSLQ